MFFSLKSMYILAPTTDTTSTTPHTISNIMPVSNNILRSEFILRIVETLEFLLSYFDRKLPFH